MTLELDLAHAYSRWDGLFGSLQSWSTRQTWPGQVAFTAGRAHGGDGDVAAALDGQERRRGAPAAAAWARGREARRFPSERHAERASDLQLAHRFWDCLVQRQVLSSAGFLLLRCRGGRTSGNAKDSIHCFPLTVPSGSAHLCMLAQAEVNRWHSARRQFSRVVVHALIRGVPSPCLRTVVPGGRFGTRLSTFSRSFFFFFTPRARELLPTMC